MLSALRHDPTLPGNILFVTATDTNVGKTCICGLLLDFLLRAGRHAVYQKWAACGGGGLDDLQSCLALCEKKPAPITPDLQTPYRYRAAVAPHLAAELEGRPPIDPAVLKKSSQTLAGQHEILLVEGVGGLLVPLRRDLLLADLVAELNLSTLIVARSGLGTINHTLLTIEAARHRGIRLLGVIFTDSEPDADEALVRDNMQTVADLGRITVIGRLPSFTDPGQARAAFAGLGAKILALLDAKD